MNRFKDDEEGPYRFAISASGDFDLDDEDIQLLRLLAEGLSAESIAPRMHLSSRTVRRRVRALCERAGVATPIQVVVEAVRRARL